MSHTPGPWEVAFSNGYKSAVKSGDIVIARAFCKYSPPGKTYDEMGAEAEANARLIAAAPEMYELLDAALLELEQDGKCTGLIEDIQLLFKRIHGESK